jgi:anti-anti-sigma factor
MQHPPVEVTVDDSGGRRLAHVRGVLDVFSSSGLPTRALAGIPEQTRALLVDLGGVSFVDSAGVSALVKLRQECKARALDVRAHFGGAQQRINTTIVDVLRRVMPCDD